VTGNVKGLIFDMDNTLFDLVGAKKKACHSISASLRRKDGARIYSYFTRRVLEYEDPGNLRDYLVDQGMYSEPTYLECCRIYQREKLRHIVAYPGVTRTLSHLRNRGFPTALVTDAHLEDTRLRLDTSGLTSYFDHIVTCDHTGKKKPDPAPFLLALDLLGTSARETLLVGDSLRRDIEPGHRLGLVTAYARYGDRSPDRGKSGAHHVLSRFSDLLDLLPANEPGRGSGHEPGHGPQHEPWDGSGNESGHESKHEPWNGSGNGSGNGSKREPRNEPRHETRNRSRHETRNETRNEPWNESGDLSMPGED
jgi:putative hydrolase of the HAD superfamily